MSTTKPNQTIHDWKVSLDSWFFFFSSLFFFFFFWIKALSYGSEFLKVNSLSIVKKKRHKTTETGKKLPQKSIFLKAKKRLLVLVLCSFLFLSQIQLHHDDDRFFLIPSLSSNYFYTSLTLSWPTVLNVFSSNERKHFCLHSWHSHTNDKPIPLFRRYFSLENLDFCFVFFSINVCVCVDFMTTCIVSSSIVSFPSTHSLPGDDPFLQHTSLQNYIQIYFSFCYHYD